MTGKRSIQEVMTWLEKIRLELYQEGKLEEQDIIEEAVDILYDYEYATKELIALQQKEMPEKPKKRKAEFFCPACGRRICFRNTYCHWCGKKLTWTEYTI